MVSQEELLKAVGYLLNKQLARQEWTAQGMSFFSQSLAQAIASQYCEGWLETAYCLIWDQGARAEGKDNEDNKSAVWKVYSSS